MTHNPDSIQELLAFLFSLHRFGIKPGLERIQLLLSTLGNPEKSYPCIHVAGTNGKGSVCSLLASILQSAGYKTGLYTSPHLRVFNERIRVNGTMISDADIARLSASMMEEIKREPTTFFEVTTAMAFKYFEDQQVDIAIIETGMGGRLDGTNVIDHPLATVITSIDKDHVEYLGDTLLEIAGEKAGIFKEQAPVIIGEQRKELQEFFKGFALHKKTGNVYTVDEYCNGDSLIYSNDLHMTFNAHIDDLGYDQLCLDKAGIHQMHNALTALLTLKVIAKQFPVDESHIRYGALHCSDLTGVKGRIQCIAENPMIVMDVGHNPACLQRLKETLHLCGHDSPKWHIVFGAMADKPINEMLEILKPLHAEILCCAPSIERAMKTEELQSLAHAMNMNAQAYASVADAVETALQKKEPVLITGSFYLADEAVQVLEHRGFTL